MDSRHKVLIVDDDPAVLELFRELLSHLPSRPEVFTATSGARALALLKSEPIRLMLCDLKMPRMDGLQVLAIVRRSFPELRTVVITAVADARSREALAKVVDKIRSLKAWMGVIDGGGNRTEMDRRLYGLAALVLLPFRDSHEDIRTVIRDLEMFPRAYAIPTQWPTNPWQREAAEKTVAEMLAPYSDRILNPVFALSASKQLLQKQIPSPVPTQVTSSFRVVARQILDLLQIPVEEESMDQVRREAPAMAAASMMATVPTHGPLAMAA